MGKDKKDMVMTIKNKIQAIQWDHPEGIQQQRNKSFLLRLVEGLLKPLSCRQENPGDREYI